jgi:hypothetical protein
MDRLSPMQSDSTRLSPLRGRQLAFARTAWIAVVVLTVALFVTALPLRYAELQQVCVGAACTMQQLTLDDVRELQTLGLSRDFHARYHVALEVTFALVHLVIATVIFARKSDDRMALFVSFMLVTFGAATFTSTMSTLAQSSSAWQLPMAIVSPLPGALPGWLRPSALAWRLPVALASALGQVSAALCFYLFPDGNFVPRWTRVLAITWIAWQIPAIFFPDSLFNSEHWPPWLALTVWSGFIISYVFAQIYRYRRVSDAQQRLQTKWIVYGATTALCGFLGAVLLSSLLSTFYRPTLLYRGAINTAIYLSMLLIPLSISVAILRSHLWAIDIIINRTLVYSVLTITLALIYFASIVLLQVTFRIVVGRGQPATVIVISTLAIAALFTPLRQRVQTSIDRRFYRRKYDAAQTLAAFSAALRDQVDLDKLSADLIAVVQETMQPAHASLWLRQTSRERTRSNEV